MRSGTPEALGQGNWGTPRFSAPLPPCTESGGGKHKELQDLAYDIDFRPSLLLCTFSQDTLSAAISQSTQAISERRQSPPAPCPGNQLVLK